MNKFINKQSIAFVISSLGLFGFFIFVNPEGKPLPYVFLPVILAWISLYSLVQFILKFVYKDTNRLRTVIVFVCVSFVILLLLLSGIGQLTTSDVVLASILVLVSTFYFYRTWS